MKKSLKRSLAVLCVLTLAVGSALAATAATTRMLEARYPGITLTVNGKTVQPTDVDGAPTEPFIVDGTTYVPVRAIGEALGKAVTWDPKTNTVTVGLAPMAEDARQLIGTIESTHPAFALDAVPVGYEAAKSALLAAADAPNCTTYDFAWAALAYTATLGDGHTALNIFGATPQPALNLGWLAEGDHLWLTDAAGAPTKVEVTAIGGLAVRDIFAAVDRYAPWENASGRDRAHAAWAGQVSFLNHIGAALTADYSGAVVALSDGTERTVLFAQPKAAVPEASITAKQMGDVFYIDMNQCVLDAANAAVAAQLAQAVKDGTSKVIIDVRGNGGGNSAACEQLLAAMGMAAPSYGGILRYSPLAQEQRGYDVAEGVLRQEPDLSTAQANPKVRLVVLTDEETFSSATMLAVMVRDGKLGAVIGRTSINAPNSYGDILYYQLGNSGLQGSVSHIQWLRPDQSADPKTVTPDLVTPAGADSLQTALDYLKG